LQVRFVTKSSKKGKDGKALRKLKWYGGVVTDIATGGKRVRIKYDDGTSEVADFPDKDIVVDNEGNGQHKHGTDPKLFLPPMPTHPQKSQQQQTPPQSQEVKEPLQTVDSEKKAEKPNKARKGDLTLDEIEELRQQKLAAKAAKAKASRAAEGAAASAAPSGGPPAKDENAKQQDKEAKKRRTSTPSPEGDDGETKPKVAADAGATTAPCKVIRPTNSPSSSSSSNSSSSEVVRRKKKKDAGGKRKRKRSDSPEGVPTTVATKPRKKPSKSAMELTLERAAARLEGNKAASPETKKPVTTDKSAKPRSSKEVKVEPSKPKDAEVKMEKSPMLEDENKKSVGDDADAIPADAGTGTANDVQLTETKATEQKGSKKRAVSPSAANAVTEPPRKKAAPEDRESSTGKSNTAAEAALAVAAPMVSEKNKDNAADQMVSKAESAVDSTKEEKVPVSEATEDEKPAAAAAAATADSPAETSKKMDEKVEQQMPMEVDDAPNSMETDMVKEAADDSTKITVSVPTDGAEASNPAKGGVAGEISKTPPPVTETPRSKSPGPSPRDESKKAKKVALPPVQRSGRRAAQKANELIVAKEERIIKEASSHSKSGKKKEELKIRRSFSKASDDDDNESGEDDDHWAQCEKCQKWRILPASVDKDKLPDPWFCEMNTYDPKRNSCEAPEQTVQEVAKEKKKKKAREERRRQKKLASASPRSPKGAGKSPPVPDATESKAPTEDLPPKSDQKKGKRKSPTPADAGADADAAKPSSEKDAGGKVLSTSTTFEKAKKARQKTASDASGAAESKSSSRSRSKPKSGKEKSEKEKKKVAKAKKGKKGRKEESDEEDPDNVEWVQCEKCEKWRKLPPHISAEDLPEVWYCNMNTWDPDSASCGVEEDKMDSSHREFQIMGEGGTFTTSFGSSGKLSYRNLIFGTKGKQNRPLSERQRAADSLFSYQPLDPLGMAAGPPTCLYSTSSAFFHRGASQQKAAAEEANRVSFINVLSQSRLWDELYRGARAMQSLPIDPANTDAPVSTHVGSMTGEMYVRSMKALIYHAIGTRTLPAHEVLLEAQCRQWDDAQWAELRASCTIDVVTHALNLLVKDGLVQTTTDAATGVLQFKRTNIDGLPKTDNDNGGGKAKADSAGEDKKLEADAKKLESRCMKISKPWKRNKNLTLDY